MAMNIVLNKTVGDSEPQGGKFPKPFHAYKAVMGKPFESDKGWYTIPIITESVQSGEYDALSVKSNSQYLSDIIGRWANAVAKSNPKLVEAGMLDAKQVDVSKWEGKKIGVVYMPQKTKESGYKEDGKFSQVAYAIPYDEVDEFKVDTEAHDKWYAATWGANASPSTQPQQQQSTPPADDGLDLPF